MAFVVVLHFGAEFDSSLDASVQQEIAMPVGVAEDGEEVQVEPGLRHPARTPACDLGRASAALEYGGADHRSRYGGR